MTTETVAGASPQTARLIRFFETMTMDELPRLGEIYADDCRFKDPFHEVHGVEAVRRIYAHMYRALHEPRFRVVRSFEQGRECMLVWEFLFAFRRTPRQPQVVKGCPHLVLAGDGRIQAHRDYWDAAEELYEKLPGLGALMRWIKRRARA